MGETPSDLLFTSRARTDLGRANIDDTLRDTSVDHGRFGPDTHFLTRVTKRLLHDGAFFAFTSRNSLESACSRRHLGGALDGAATSRPDGDEHDGETSDQEHRAIHARRSALKWVGCLAVFRG